MRLTRVIVVADHPLVREWLKDVIRRESDMVVSGEAADRDNALATIIRKRPGLAIVDVALRNSSGLDLVKDVRSRRMELPILMLATMQDEIFVERSIRAGAHGCFFKEEPTNKILDALREIRSGKVHLGTRPFQQAAPRTAGDSRIWNHLDKISDRELQLLELLGQGCDSREIANYMRLGVKTTETYRSRLSKKLHLSSASLLLREAVSWRRERVTTYLCANT